MYSEGVAHRCSYALYFTRSRGNRTIYGFTRNVERAGGASDLTMDGGRPRLKIVENRDGSLKFVLTGRAGPRPARP